MGKKYFVRITIGFFLILILVCATANDAICDRRPLGTKTDPLRPDNQFVLEIDDIINNQYLPEKRYTVTLRSRDNISTFMAFSISLEEDTEVNKENPRKPHLLNPGVLKPLPGSSTARLSETCKNTIVESDVTAKTITQAYWTAPGKGNKCVTIFAVLAKKPDVWYSYESPLSKKVCEDPRKSDDMPPLEVDGDCKVCEDARYQLTFEGLWSYNTHPNMFPIAQERARFSDVVGASHSPSTTLFKLGSEASEGIKMLAEQGNTTQFEIETQKMLIPKWVRTVIKATSPEQTNMSTLTSFRATREHHRLSIATGILPSPDWFLGVSNLELCTEEFQWASKIRLNLYPIDAGTDKGVDFESSNEEQSPHQPISTVVIRNTKKEETKPFARLHLTLIRTYTTPDCVTEAAVTEEQEGEEGGEIENGSEDDDKNDDSNEPERPSYETPRTTTSEEPPLEVDPNSSEKCPMTNWEEWQPCDGVCVNNTLSGIQTRFRYHIVDGIAIKYIDSDSPVSQYCLDNFKDMDEQICEGTCNEIVEDDNYEEEENDAEASRRTWESY